MKEIKLYNSNMVALVDDEDYALVAKYRWRLNQGYAYSVTQGSRKSRKSIKMHRLVLNLTNPKISVDHIDNNKLNNTKTNLRICTSSQNSRNTIKRSNTKCRYKGVSYDARRKKNPWYARIRYNYKYIHIGCFSSEEEAALAYNEKAKELFGEFANLN